MPINEDFHPVPEWRRVETEGVFIELDVADSGIKDEKITCFVNTFQNGGQLLLMLFGDVKIILQVEFNADDDGPSVAVRKMRKHESIESITMDINLHSSDGSEVRGQTMQRIISFPFSQVLLFALNETVLFYWEVASLLLSLPVEELPTLLELCEQHEMAALTFATTNADNEREERLAAMEATEQ